MTALIIVTVVSTLAASMVWQQWRAIQVESAERSRVQSAWILQGALDWSRLILREDARTGGADHLGEPWAVPLAEARLSTFLAADRDNSDDAPDAFLSGRIDDAQARFNLRNLVQDGKVSEPDLRALQRLCEAEDVSPAIAQALARGLLKVSVANPTAAAASGVSAGTSVSTDSSANVPLPPFTLDQLTWLGVDADSLRRLRPYIVLLPNRTTLNLNTASREVLAAVVDRLDLAGAERLVQTRQRTPFKSLSAAQELVPTGVILASERVGVTSSYFEVRGRLRWGERVLEERSLIERRGTDIIPLWRERVSAVEGS